MITSIHTASDTVTVELRNVELAGAINALIQYSRIERDEGYRHTAADLLDTAETLARQFTCPERWAFWVDAIVSARSILEHTAA